MREMNCWVYVIIVVLFCLFDIISQDSQLSEDAFGLVSSETRERVDDLLADEDFVRGGWEYHTYLPMCVEERDIVVLTTCRTSP